MGALIPQVEVTFVMPSQTPGKESSGGDVESFVPDSSSIPDDMLVGKLYLSQQKHILTCLLRFDSNSLAKQHFINYTSGHKQENCERFRKSLGDFG